MAHGHCFTKLELCIFTRTVVETSSHSCVVPVDFQSTHFVDRFRRRYSSLFNTSTAHTLNNKRANHSTEERMRNYFSGLKGVKNEHQFKPGSIWNWYETGTNPQGSSRRQIVFAPKGMPANRINSDDRDNVTTLCCECCWGIISSVLLLSGQENGTGLDQPRAYR